MTDVVAVSKRALPIAVMAFDDGVIPLQERIESVGDVSDLEEVYNPRGEASHVGGRFP